MGVVPYTAGLHRLTPHTYAYLHPVGSWGQSNCGVVTDQGEGLLIDTQFTIPLTRRLCETLAAKLPRTAIGTIVNTHANGDHCWGNQLFQDAVIIGSDSAAHQMAREVQPRTLAALAGPDPPQGPLGDYMRRFFGSYDFSGITVTPPNQTFTGQLRLIIGAGTLVELLEVGPAHTDGDVIVLVPGEGVAFTGDILFIGDHPIMWSGTLNNWLAACTRILESGSSRIVPGHGPVVGPAEVIRFRDYLEYVGEQAAVRYRAGMPYWEAALDIPVADYADWGHRERLVITLAAVYRELGLDEPFDPVTVMTRTAWAFQKLDQQGTSIISR
jgi:cyclase